MKTDSQLQQDVIAELRWEPSINATRIGVEVNQGVVTLSGHVDRYADKWNAGNAAKRVLGVQTLALEIDVDLTESEERNDTDIAMAARSALTSSFLPTDAVKVAVESGWVTLTGEVEWNYQRQWAGDAVRALRGVMGVTDATLVKSRVSADDVKAEIEAALRRRARADAQAILVEVSGDEVILSGIVHSWSEHELATHSAWGAPGVRGVVNNMTVSS